MIMIYSAWHPSSPLPIYSKPLMNAFPPIIIIYSVTSFIPSSHLQWAIHEWITSLPYSNTVSQQCNILPPLPRVFASHSWFYCAYLSILWCWSATALASPSCLHMECFTFHSMGSRTSNPVHIVCHLRRHYNTFHRILYSVYSFLFYSAPPMFSGWFTVRLSLKPPPLSLRV